MPVPLGEYSHRPSCLDKMKYGFCIGLAIGLSTGAIFGTYSGLRAGFRGKELVHAVGRSMFQGGGSFGVFMVIGQAIRC